VTKIAKNPKSFQVNLPDEPNITFSIHDTELLLRILLDTQYSGRDVAQATDTIEKVRKIHEKLLKKQELIR